MRVTRLAQLTQGTTERQAEIIAQHVDYLMDLGKRGIMLLFGHTTENDQRRLALRCFRWNPQETQGIMENDPAVKNGVTRAMLHPLQN